MSFATILRIVLGLSLGVILSYADVGVFIGVMVVIVLLLLVVHKEAFEYGQSRPYIDWWHL